MLVKPDLNLNSIYDIDLKALKEMGIKALVLDLDSTIMVSKMGEYTERTERWLREVQENFLIAVVTNNNDQKYLNKVKAISPFPIYGNAKKPDPTVLKNAITGLCLTPKYIAYVGDRPLTDIIAGKEVGAAITILVDSINAENENTPTRFVRWLERLFIKK